jgi:long-chain-fatty-acid--CoA ligase ACSBG
LLDGRAISKAQWVRKWYIIDGDFTVEGGDLTPTLKLKRKVVTEKHSEVIEKLYEDPKL